MTAELGIDAARPHGADAKHVSNCSGSEEFAGDDEPLFGHAVPNDPDEMENRGERVEEISSWRLNMRWAN